MKDYTKNYVRELRQNSTDSENHLWFFLRAKRLEGFKFRRQHLIYPYIVDFVCLEKKLIVELDGGQHVEQKEYDEYRCFVLKSKGFQILRFWNDVVLKETNSVLQIILDTLNNNKKMSF